MFRSTIRIIFLLLLTISATAAPGTSKSGKVQDSPKPPVEKVDEWVAKAISEFQEKSLAELRKIPNLKKETKSKEAFHDGESHNKQDYIRLEFEGLIIGGFLSKDSFLLQEVIITSANWQIPDGVAIGGDPSIVPSVFGLPMRPLKPRELFSGWTQSMVVFSKNSKITKIAFYCFFD